MPNKHHSIEFQDQACKLVTEQGYTREKAADRVGNHHGDAAGLAEESRKPLEPIKVIEPDYLISNDPALLKVRIKELEKKLKCRGDREGDFKKSDGLLRQSEPVRFDWISKHADVFEVAMMCEVLDVSRSGYYAWSTRAQRSPTSARRSWIGQIEARISKARALTAAGGFMPNFQRPADRCLRQHGGQADETGTDSLDNAPKVCSLHDRQPP